MSVPLSAFAADEIADSCGTPTPETIRVVQIDPGPMPHLMASAPASAKALAPSAVAMFPAITSILYRRFTSRTVFTTFLECPWAESTTSTSTPALIRDSARS